MELEILDAELSICKPARWEDWSDAAQGLFFLARTDEELSLVCPSDKVPADCLAREDGFRALRVRGPLDFSLVGVLSSLLCPLAERGISVFAVSTFDTDYILVRGERLEETADALTRTGCRITG